MPLAVMLAGNYYRRQAKQMNDEAVLFICMINPAFTF